MLRATTLSSEYRLQLTPFEIGLLYASLNEVCHGLRPQDLPDTVVTARPGLVQLQRHLGDVLRLAESARLEHANVTLAKEDLPRVLSGLAATLEGIEDPELSTRTGFTREDFQELKATLEQICGSDSIDQ